MADYRADPEKMMEGSRQVRSLAEIVGQYAQDVRSVERNLQIQNNLGWGIRQSLGHLSQTLEEDSRKTNALSDGLEKAAIFYGQTEERSASITAGSWKKSCQEKMNLQKAEREKRKPNLIQTGKCLGHKAF